ncbi:MAG: Spo0B domain-containing protein [Desulfitobacteriaceae bacterium]
MPEIEEKLLAEQVDWYKLQRHDFLNHWQVIMGYLQLKQADKALAYMRKAVQSLTPEQQVGQISEPVTAAILLGFIIHLRLEGIASVVGVSQELKKEVFWQKPEQKGYAEALYGYTMECLDIVRSQPVSPDEVSAEIEVGHNGGRLSCAFSLCRGEDRLAEKLFLFTFN